MESTVASRGGGGGGGGSTVAALKANPQPPSPQPGLEVYKNKFLGATQGAIGATWPNYIGPTLVLITAAAALASDPKLLPYLF